MTELSPMAAAASCARESRCPPEPPARDRHSADAPSPSLLKRLLETEKGVQRNGTVSPTAPPAGLGCCREVRQERDLIYMDLTTARGDQGRHVGRQSIDAAWDKALTASRRRQAHGQRLQRYRYAAHGQRRQRQRYLPPPHGLEAAAGPDVGRGDPEVLAVDGIARLRKALF